MSRWLYLSVAATVVVLAATPLLYYGEYDRLAEQVPHHWNIHGQPDAFTPRERVLPLLLLSPAGMACIVALTLILPWLSPRSFTVDGFRPTFDYVMFLVVLLIGHIQAVTLAVAFQYVHDPARWMVAGILLMLALMGNVLGKVRRNFWMGVRTPWTLADPKVWERTHRVAAWLFTAAGVAGFVAVLAGAPLALCFVGLIAAALVVVLYSLVLYKRLEKQGKLSSSDSTGA
jgi:uncharacterized membrane protein